MLAPISWLEEFIEIKIPLKDLCSKLTEAGLGVEEIIKINGDQILNIEVTANRPDWMSIYGIAREISAITNTPLKEIDQNRKGIKVVSSDPQITITPNYQIVPRIISIIITNVKVQSSPSWLQNRIKQVGLRPINNLVDITNYLLWTYGSLLHVFDYDEIHGKKMTVQLSKGGETFTSLDHLSYQLPPQSIIIKDKDRIIDLLPLKGGENSAVTSKTKNILLHSVIVDPLITRRTSQALNLRSDSSVIAERGLDPNGCKVAVNKAIDLILQLAGGKIASPLIDHKEKPFNPWTINLNIEKTNNILGINFTKDQIIALLARLNLKVVASPASLSSAKNQNKSLTIKIPTYRQDLQIEEDLIEEVGRIYGYNRFPKNKPVSLLIDQQPAYYKNYYLDLEIKNLLTSCGFSEIYTYSLVEAKKINLANQKLPALKVANPLSQDYQYLRPTLLSNLLSAISQNQPYIDKINIFELGKIYQGGNIDKYSETLELCVATNEEKGLSVLKSFLDILSKKYQFTLKIQPSNHFAYDPSSSLILKISNITIGYLGQINKQNQIDFNLKYPISCLLIDYSKMIPFLKKNFVFKPLSKYPAIIEDLTLIVPPNTNYQDIEKNIFKVNTLINNIEFLGLYNNSLSLRLTFQSNSGNLTDKEIQNIRKQIFDSLSTLNITLKTGK